MGRIEKHIANAKLASRSRKKDEKRNPWNENGILIERKGII